VASQEATLKKNIETLQLAQAETARLFTELQEKKVASKGMMMVKRMTLSKPSNVIRSLAPSPRPIVINRHP